MTRNFLLLPLLALSVFCTSCTTTNQRRVPFAVSSQRFAEGDLIVIREVVTTSGDLRMGDKVVVRGDYQLASHPKAALCLFITTRGPSGGTPVSPKQRVEVAVGRGSFELQHEIQYAGALHVSFYPVPSGSSFGGVYFGETK